MLLRTAGCFPGLRLNLLYWFNNSNVLPAHGYRWYLFYFSGRLDTGVPPEHIIALRSMYARLQILGKTSLSFLY